jgi:hypothetical protein
MKIHVVKDKSGKVIASYESAAGNGPSLTPVLTSEHRVEEIEVADNYKEDLRVLYSPKVS